MKKTIHRVDAFADKQYKGNPSGVYFLQEDLTDAALQKMTLHARLPVTAFVKSLADNTYTIRWFTPNCEVNLCGHGTMAATYWLYQTFGHRSIHFQSKSGPLNTQVNEEEKIVMDFPAQVCTPTDPSIKETIENALGRKVKNCLFGYEDYLVELDSGKAVVDFEPNFTEILQVDCRGIIITAWDDQYGFDCISRFFCPRVGINEDQVCVSAHCKILPYWQSKKGKKYLHAWQASANGGELHLYSLDNNRVQIQGKAKRGKDTIVEY